MSAGLRVHAPRDVFAAWIRSTPAAALPADLLAEVRIGPADAAGPSAATSAGSPAGSPAGVTPVDAALPGPESAGPPIPPTVAAALAMQGCAEIAVMLRLRAGPVRVVACFVFSGDLAASVVVTVDDVQIGLFAPDAVVDEVVRLVPPVPPDAAGAADEFAGLEITVLAADEACAGWYFVLAGGSPQWRRIHPGLDAVDVEPVPDVRGRLAAELRFVLAGQFGVGCEDDETTGGHHG